MSAIRFTLATLAAVVIAQAQIPGQFPPGQSPPGQYPPGQYPGQTGRYPGRGGRGRSSGPSAQSSARPATTVTLGMLRRAAGSQFVLEADDHRIITYRTSSKTAILKDGKDADLAKFGMGDRLSVDSTEDDNGFFTAVSVRFEKAATPADRAAAAETWNLPVLDGAAAADASSPAREPGDDRPILRRKDEPAPKVETAKSEPVEPVDTRPATTIRPPDPAPDADDPGPPVLKHGAPAPRKTVETASATGAEPASQNPVIVFHPTDAEPATVSATAIPAEDSAITKAKEVADSFVGTLPNFFCKQVTTRYQTDHPKQGWDALDIVTADVAYEDGSESYKNIHVGNKAVNKSMSEIGGTYSTGEFASLLDDLFSSSTGATFRRSGQDTVRGRATMVYKFEVARERSHWRVIAGGQLYYPAYRGTIWIDKETSRVLRLEEQARNVPPLFPFDTVESATDYDFVRLSTLQPFLLPVDAEVLSCVRSSSHCTRNRIEFRNYRKFGAESDVTFDDKP
jgi:hypothetical protein